MDGITLGAKRQSPPKNWAAANLAERRRPGRHPMVGIEKSAPSLTPEGQRAVTVLVRV